MPALTNTTQLRHMDPSALLVDTNIRTDLALDSAFVDSIRQHGVIVPVVAVLQLDGRVRVRDGNRRTVGAIEAGRETIPVVVFDVDDVASERIAEQIVANTQRAGLTAADTVAAVEQLAWLGVDAHTIAKRTSLPRASVDQALTVAGSAAARAVMSQHTIMTLEHAAWLAEFDAYPELRDDLLGDFTGDLGRDRHVVERARQELREMQAFDTAAARVAADRPDVPRIASDTHPGMGSLHLRDIDPAEHTSCPGHAWQLRTIPQWWGDNITAPGFNGETLIEEDGFRFCPVWVCADMNAHHTPAGDSPSEPISPGAEQAQASEARRRVIALNKAGQSALTVRREWLTSFTTMLRTPPKDAPAFMWLGLAAAHTAAIHDVADGVEHVKQLLNTPGNRTQAFETWIAKQPQTALAHMSLCARLWSYEHRADKTIWRETGQQRAYYLRAIERWGYVLSDVEKVCTGDLTEEQAYTALTGDPA